MLLFLCFVPKQMFDSLNAEVTHIVHNAWMMDFNQKVNFFEPSCIYPSAVLLCMAAGASLLENKSITIHPSFNIGFPLKRFHFISSISSTMSIQGLIKETVIQDQAAASLMGYGQAKLVTERIATKFGQFCAVPIYLNRVGQIGGDSVNGVWNTREHIPLLIKAAEVMAKMPDQYMTVDWIPVDQCAAVIIELALTAEPPSVEHHSGSINTLVSHLINPHSISWQQFSLLLQSHAIGLHFELVSPKEWLNELMKPGVDPKSNPAIQLIPFYASVFEGLSKGVKQSEFETKETVKAAKTMKECAEINDFYMRKVVAYWRNIGFLN